VISFNTIPWDTLYINIYLYKTYVVLLNGNREKVVVSSVRRDKILNYNIYINYNIYYNI